MAEENPVQNLCDETTCSICLEYFKDPVIIDCGHIFCHACVSKCCEKKGTQPACPRCREPIWQKNFKPNRQLASIVETAKKFSLQVAKETEDPGKVCEEHQEPLKLFCKDDQDPVCVVCYCSKEHKEHNVIPKDKAFEEYKDKIQSHIELLKKKREEILSSKQSGMTESQNLLEKIKTQRQKITADFKQLHEFLEEQEHRLLAQLKDLDDKVNDHREKHLAKLLEELSSLDNLIKELEEKWKQSENELLQDVKIILQRCNQKTLVNPAFPPNLKKQIEQLSEMYSLPDVKKCIDAVFSGHQEENIQGCSGSGLMPQLEGENNKTTNNSSPPQAKLLEKTRYVPKLALQVIGTTLPKGYNRYYFSCVLGAERISSGIHSWELSEGFERFWAAGVARDSISLHNTSVGPEFGIWAVGRRLETNPGILYVFTSPGMPLWDCPTFTNVVIKQPSQSYISHKYKMPSRIRVILNYEEGSVTFVDVNNDVTIYTFSNISFAGQQISSWVGALVPDSRNT